MSGGYKYKCNVPTCKNVYRLKVANKHFFAFPKCRTEREGWFAAINARATNKIEFTDKHCHICEDHFTDSCFTSTERKRLHKFARPSVFAHHNEKDQQCIQNEHNYSGAVNYPTSSNSALRDNATLNEINSEQSSQSATVKKAGIPRKRGVYYINRARSNKIAKLKCQLTKNRNNAKAAKRRLRRILLQTVDANLRELNRRSTFNDKSFYLALYSRGPKFYEYLKQFLNMPSKFTLGKLLQKVPLQTGINARLFDMLRERVAEINAVDKVCKLMFDEMLLSTSLSYSHLTDCIVGYEDLGSLGRGGDLANHALVFMIQSLQSGWKQPVAYFFTKNGIKSEDLKYLIKEIIEQLLLIGLTVICTVCDLAVRNRSTLNLLKQETNGNINRPYFTFKSKKIFILYDTTSLLRSTRNALANYTVLYDDKKKAKFGYLLLAHNYDKHRRFQSLGKIREPYLYIDRCKTLKRKVSVAAKTLSRTMATAIETLALVDFEIPSEAIETAEFVNDVNDLFDSLNSGRTKIDSYNSPLRRSITRQSMHVRFWNDLRRKIQSWKFYDESADRVKENLPLKLGWINNVKSMKLIWATCERMGFKFLRTRMSNLDSLKNLFGMIRQYGSSNVNPTCFQFVSALKTSILNSPKAYKIRNMSCEEDHGHILDNLLEFLDDEVIRPVIAENENELNCLNRPNFYAVVFVRDALDAQALACICGVLVKNIKTLDCKCCRESLFVENIDMQFYDALIKESDNVRLGSNYVNKNLTVTVAFVYDVICFYLERLGHIKNIVKKLKIILHQNTDFAWFACKDHSKDVKIDIIRLAIKFIFNKYIADMQRIRQHKNRGDVSKKVKIFKRV